MNSTITGAIATAKRLIEQFGATVAWTQYVATAGALPEEPGPRSTRSFTPKIVFTRDKRINYEFLKFISKTEVIGNDQSFLLAGDCGFTPAKDDTFVYSGKLYTIDNMSPVRPDGRVVLWIGKLKA